MTSLVYGVTGHVYAQNEDEHNQLQGRLHFEHAIEVPIKRLSNKLYVR